LSKEVVVHSLTHALAALAAAEALGVPVTLASAPAAALQTGPGWFKSVIDQARETHPRASFTAVLDCGDAAGAAMASLRLGLRQLRFAGTEPVRAKLAAMGAEFVAPAPDALDLRDAQSPAEAARVFLSRG
jgi:hypothetical protein